MALIGSIAINMVTRTTGFTKGLASGQSALQKFAGAASKVGQFLGGSVLESNVAGVNSIGQAFRNASLDARTLGKAGLLDTSNKLRILGNLASDLRGPIGGLFAGMISGMTRAGGVVLRSGVMAFQALSSAVMGTVGFVADLTKRLLFFGAIAGGIALAAIWNVAKGAVALAEQADRARIVFGKFTGEVIGQANLMATAFGVSRREFIQSASALGTVFEGVGYTQEGAAKLSVHFVKLATDLSSFAHIPVAEAMEKIQSGLAGQIRPLREVGVFMTEASVETYAYAHGIAKLGAELTEQEKVQARIGFITEKLAIAQGNLAQTAGGAGNELRSLSGRFENLKDSIGAALLQFLVPALDEINTGLQAISLAWQASGLAAKDSAIGVLGGAQGQVQSIGFIQSAVMRAADAWQSFKVMAIDAVLAVNGAIIKMAQALQETASIFDRLRASSRPEAGTPGIVAIAPGLELGIQKLQDMRRELIKLQDAQKGAPKPSLAIADAFASARESIGKARDELAGQGKLDVNKLKPVPEGAAKAAGVPKFASVALQGSQEAANAVLKARFGGGGGAANEPAKKTAENTKKTVDLLSQAVGKLDAIARQGLGNIGDLFIGNF